MENNKSNISKTLSYLLIGGGIGATLALLFAPKSGSELRQDISTAANTGLEKGKEKAAQLRDSAGEYYETAKEKAGELYVATTDKVSQIAETASNKVSQIAENVSDKTSEISKDVKKLTAEAGNAVEQKMDEVGNAIETEGKKVQNIGSKSATPSIM